MKKSIIIGLLILLTGLYIYRVYRVNTEFESIKEEIIPFGTEREVSDGVSMKVNDYKMISGEEAVKNYGYEYSSGAEEKVILVNVTYFNNTKENKTVDTRPDSIEKTGFTTATELVLYQSLNSFGLDIKLSPGEEREVILPYIIYKFQFKQSEWDKIEEEIFYISNSRYPVKTKWLLKK